MKKNLLLVLMVLSVTFAFAGGRDDAAATSDNYKVGIITGTVSQGEEEFQAAQKMAEMYPGQIVTATYPDRFNEEVETTISRVVQLASDPEVKAIVFVQAVPGAIAAIEKVRETRPDMLFVTGVAAEPPREIAAVADIVMLVDELGVGRTLVEQAQKQGAKTFVHYSFPRHLGYETIAARRNLFMETAEAAGMEYVEATAPDPTGDAGVSGAQQFIVEDVPRKLAEYGKDTVFFSTNCSMQEPLIRSVIEQGGVYSLQCCPSPYHGFPAALNISTEGHEGDVQYMLEQIDEKVTALGNEGRVSTFPVSINMLMVEAGTDYAMRYAAGEFTDRHNPVELEKSINKVIAQSGEYGSTLSLYEDAEGSIDNFYMIMCDYYNF